MILFCPDSASPNQTSRDSIWQQVEPITERKEGKLYFKQQLDRKRKHTIQQSSWQGTPRRSPKNRSQKYKSDTNLLQIWSQKYKFQSPGRPHQYQLQVPFPAAPEGDMVGIEEKRSVTHLQKSRFPENHSH